MSVRRLSRSLEEGHTYSGAAFAEQLEVFIDRLQDSAVFQKAVLREAHEALLHVRDAIIGRPPVDAAKSAAYYAMFARMYRRVVSSGHSREQMNYWFLLAEGFVERLSRAARYSFSGLDVELLGNLAKMFRLIAEEGEHRAYSRGMSDDDDE
ncbi:MAG: hypothetical protein WC734_03685 [Patescibacteria group bacterium]|jgi:hypothetical protein